MRETIKSHRSRQAEDSPATPRRTGRRQESNMPVAAILVGIALLTAIGSLYVYMAGYRARIEKAANEAEERKQILISEITWIQRQLAEEESYMKLRPKVYRWGMEDLRPGDCKYLEVPSEEDATTALGAPAHANAPGASGTAEGTSP